MSGSKRWVRDWEYGIVGRVGEAAVVRSRGTTHCSAYNYDNVGQVVYVATVLDLEG